MHLNDEHLERLLDRELAWTEAEHVHAHVGECAGCRDRLAAARHEEEQIATLLRHLDHPRPRLTAATLVARARSRDWRCR